MFEVIQAKKSDKKAILRFYKSLNYSAGFLGLDATHFIVEQKAIVACVIISKIHPDSNQYFLHGLVTAPTYRNRGLAKQLLTSSRQNYSPLICFAHSALTTFYLNNKFLLVPKEHIPAILPAHLLLRFQRYQKKQPDLQVFIFE